MRQETAPTNRCAVLRTIPLFRTCSDRELAEIEALVDDIEVVAGEVLTREGRYEAQSFVIVSGEASVTISGKPLVTLTPGDFFGEMGTLNNDTRSATVTALTPMHLLVMDPRNLMRLLDVPGVATAMLRGMVDRLRRANEMKSD